MTSNRNANTNTNANVLGARAGGRAHVATRRGLVVGEERDRLAAGFGRRLRALRRAMGWTQATLAGVAGVSRGTVQSLELGRQRPECGTVVRLVRVLVAVEDRVAVLGELEVLAGPSWRRWKRQREPRLFTTRDVRGLPPRRAPGTAEELAQVEARIDAMIGRAVRRCRVG